MTFYRCFTFGFLFLLGTHIIGAQAEPSITGDAVGSISSNRTQDQKPKFNPQQRATIFVGIRQSMIEIKRPPSDFAAFIGMQVSSSIELYALPDAVISAVPDAKQYKFTMINDTVILVDPVSMRIADTIRQ